MKEEEEEMEAKTTVDLNLEVLKRVGDGKTGVIETMKVMTFKISSTGKQGISQMEKKKKMKKSNLTGRNTGLAVK